LKVAAEMTHVRGRSFASGDVTVEWVVESVAGSEGQAVKEAQARAIGELAKWLYEQRKQKE
jgi:hypothetical protein